MILFELKAIGINILFGLFFFILVNTFSLYEVKLKKKSIINLFYFVITVGVGILYIIYLDLLLYSFNFYYILFIIMGFYIGNIGKLFKTKKYLPTFNYFIVLNLKIIKKIFLFLINYSLWKKVKFKRKEKKLNNF